MIYYAVVVRDSVCRCCRVYIHSALSTVVWRQRT